MKSLFRKTKEPHTHKVFFTDVQTKKEKSFTCPKDMLHWHLEQVRKINTNVRYERNV